jgi:hypothetical protein
VLLVGAIASVSAIRIAAHGASRRAPSPLNAALAAAERLPAAPPPAFTPQQPRLLNRSEVIYRWAPLLRKVQARTAPADSSPTIAALDTLTPEGTTNVLLVAGDRVVRGVVWVRVWLAVLPNDTTGWIPRSALGGYHFVHTHLIIDRERQTAALYDNRRIVFRAPVGVGQREWPTPAGFFYVRERLTKFASPFYGPLAFGTNARSSVLTDWPGGGFIGIHGTNEPQLLPGHVSHGCIRLRNADILRLSRLMPVGTPVTIR